MVSNIREAVEVLKAQRLFCRTIVEALEGRVADGNMTLSECAADKRFQAAQQGYTAMDEAIQWLRTNHGEAK